MNMLSDQVRNPHQWVYMQHMTGKMVDVIRFDGMVRRYYDVEKLKLIHDMCKLSGKIAVAAICLSRHQRKKYDQNRLKSGRSTFYVFEKHMIPADIGSRLDIESEVFVYTEYEEVEG